MLKHNRGLMHKTGVITKIDALVLQLVNVVGELLELSTFAQRVMRYEVTEPGP